MIRTFIINRFIW